MTQRLRHVLFDSLDALADQQTPGTDQHTSDSGVVYEQESRSGRSVYITSPWWRPGRLRLVLGMVRTNEPLSAVSKLSGVLAAAAGTGAFGIFYSSIWEMADALPSWRLGLITAMVIVTMVLWLIGTNRLWEHSRKLGDLTEAAMYNASTVATLLLSVILLYLVLFIGIFIGGIGVIESGFMSSKIGAEASLGNYVDIAWLSARWAPLRVLSDRISIAKTPFENSPTANAWHNDSNNAKTPTRTTANSHQAKTWGMTARRINIMSALWGLRLIHRGLALAVRSPLWGVSRGHKEGTACFD